MFTNALGKLRKGELSKRSVQRFLGPPDGFRVRAQYDVGFAGAVFGSNKALSLVYDPSDIVIHSEVTD
jgi:hypothetical protein